MAKAPVQRELEVLLLDGMVATWSDDRLLTRFAEETGDRSERAFRAIVERHGPRVYRICRALTGNSASAEDAFQATFLVLARKAGSLRVNESLGPWLHGVATRVASSARSQQARRSRHEASASHREEPTTTDCESDPDLARILHSEIGRLPSPYREVVYLCDIEGIAQDAAASRLGCAIGTIRSRLCRGRRTLRSRLIRKGIIPSVLVGLTANSARAVPSTRLVEITAIRATAVVSGSVSGTVPAAVVILFQEGMSTMLMTKIRIGVGAIVLGLSAATAVVFAQDRGGDVEKSRTAEKTVDPTRGDDNRHVFKPMVDRNESVKGLEVPSDKEILAKLIEQKMRATTIEVENISTKVEPIKNYPQVGPAQLVHFQYKATIRYQWIEGDTSTPKVDVVYLDHDFLRKGPQDHKVSSDEASIQIVRDRLHDALQSKRTPKDSDARLDEVERKLDRILKALERSDAPRHRLDQEVRDDFRPRLDVNESLDRLDRLKLESDVPREALKARP